MNLNRISKEFDIQHVNENSKEILLMNLNKDNCVQNTVVLMMNGMKNG